MCSAPFPRLSRPAANSLSCAGSSGASSPASSVLSRRYDPLPFVSPHFVAFAWRYRRVHSFFSLPGGRVRRRSLELLSRYLRPGIRSGNDRNSQVPGEPRLSVRSCSVDAGRTAATRPLRCRSVALVSEQQRLPRKVFRRSIAWLSDWLSTLRSAGYPRLTQDSHSVAGQGLPDGLSTPRVPLKGFRAVSFISSPFSKLVAAIRSTEASVNLLARVDVVGPMRAAPSQRARVSLGQPRMTWNLRDAKRQGTIRPSVVSAFDRRSGKNGIERTWRWR
jgi:hypothetical protein